MNLLEQQQLKRFEDVDIFGSAHRGDFASGGVALGLFDDLKTVIGALHDAQSSQMSSEGGSKGGTRGKNVILSEMKRDIGRINETARQMKTLSDVEKGYFARPAEREEAIVGAARTFIEKATPLWAKFEAYEMPADLLTEMQSDLDEYNANYGAQQSNRQSRIGAGQSLDEFIGQGSEILDELRPIVNNKFHDNPAVLTQWKSATRYPARKKAQPAPAR